MYEYINELPNYVQDKLKTIVLNSDSDSQEDMWEEIQTSRISDVYGQSNDRTGKNLDMLLKPYVECKHLIEEYQLGDLLGGLTDNMDDEDIDTTIRSFEKYGRALNVSNYDNIVYAHWEELDYLGRPEDMPGYKIIKEIYPKMVSKLVTNDLIDFNFVTDKFGYYFADEIEFTKYMAECNDYISDYMLY